MEDKEFPKQRLKRVMDELKKHMKPEDFTFTKEEWDQLYDGERTFMWHLTHFLAHETPTIYPDSTWAHIHSKHCNYQFNDQEIKCPVCGQRAYSPNFNTRTFQVVCDRCIPKDSDDLWIAIEQRQSARKNDDMPYKMDSRRIYYQYRSVVIWLEQRHRVIVHEENGKRLRFEECLPAFQVTASWVQGGTRHFPLTDSEKDFITKANPLELRIYMAEVWKTYEAPDVERYRCTTCGMTFEGKPAGYPLFAGCVCEACNIVHEQHLNDQRKRGAVCRQCGQPYGNCCC